MDWKEGKKLSVCSGSRGSGHGFRVHQAASYELWGQYWSQNWFTPESLTTCRMGDNTSSASSQTMSSREEVIALKGWAAVQRHLDSWRNGANRDLVKFNKDKCKLPHLAWESTLQQRGPTAWAAALQKRTQGPQ